MKIPDAVGVPLRVIVPAVAFPEKLAVTPAGNCAAAPIPVAPVVVNVIGVMRVLTQSVGLVEGPETVLPAGGTILKAIKLVQPVASVTVNV